MAKKENTNQVDIKSLSMEELYYYSENCKSLLNYLDARIDLKKNETVTNFNNCLKKHTIIMEEINNRINEI